MQQQRDRQPTEHQPSNGEAAFADIVPARGDSRRTQTGETGDSHVHQRAGADMQPRDRLSTREIQVATLVWQGLTNKDIAHVLNTSEQVIKNHLRTTFDKLGVWTRL